MGTILGVVLAEEMCAIPGLLHDQIEVGVARGPAADSDPSGTPQDLLKSWPGAWVGGSVCDDCIRRCERGGRVCAWVGRWVTR